MNIEPSAKKRLIIIVGIFVIAMVLFIIGLSSQGSNTFVDEESGGESGGETAVLVTDLMGPFTITYLGTTDNGVYQISVSDSSPQGRQKALQWLQDQGYEISNLDIQFIDFKNPLGGRESVE